MPQAIVRSRVWTLDQLEAVQRKPLQAELGGRSVPADHPALLLTKGGYLAFASTQPKKPDDAIQVITNANAQLSVIDPIQALHWFLSADEKSRTYLGNAHEKVQSLIDRIYNNLGYEKVAGRYREMGINPDHVFFCVNDCGAYLNVDYSNEPEFERSRRERNPYGTWPGVEFGPVTDAQGGLLRFFLDLKKMTERKQAAGETVDLTGWDEQTYLMFRLAPHLSQVRVFSYEAKAPIEFVMKPSPANDDVLTSFHFSRSTDDDLPPAHQQKTRADLGDYYLKNYSAEAHALRCFLREARIPVSKQPIHAQEVKKDFIASSQHNILTSVETAKYDHLPENVHPQTVTYDTGKTRIYQKLTRDADALILGPHTEAVTSNWDESFIELFDMWAAVTVDKQVRVETFDNRPFVVLNRKNPFTFEGKQNGDLDWNDPKVEREFIRFIKEVDPKSDPWLQFILFTRYLHEKGFVKQEPRFLFNQFDPADPEYRKFLASNLGKKKAEIPFYELEEYGQDENALFEVSVIGSASTRVPNYTEDAFDFGYWVAGNGWHGRNGGGRYGVMGSHYLGFEQCMHDHPEMANYAHFSAIQMPRTLQFEGCSLVDYADLNRLVKDGVRVNRYLRVAENFDWRMRSIFRSHANVAMASGIGSYDETARFCRMAERNDPLVYNKKMILYNQLDAAGPEHPRLMDVFLALCSDRFKKKHFIITPTLEDTKNEVLEVEQRYLRGELEASIS